MVRLEAGHALSMGVYIQTAEARLHRLGWHVSLAEGDGQLQVLLFLPPQPCQPLLFCFLALPLGPGQLLLLIAKLQRKIWDSERGTQSVGRGSLGQEKPGDHGGARPHPTYKEAGCIQSELPTKD